MTDNNITAAADDIAKIVRTVVDEAIYGAVRNLNLWLRRKIKFWGSVSSIIALLMALGSRACDPGWLKFGDGSKALAHTENIDLVASSEDSENHIETTDSDCSRNLGSMSLGPVYKRSGFLGDSCVTRHYSDGEYAMYYGFTLDEAADVTIDMKSGEVDSWLALRRGQPPGSAEPLESNDDAPDTLDARIIRSLDAGEYTIEATTWLAGETGDFMLTVTAEGIGCSRRMGRLVPPELSLSRTGSLGGDCVSENDPGGKKYALYYGFTLDQAATVTIDMMSFEVDAWLVLRSGSTSSSVDRLLSYNDNAQVRKTDARIERFLNAGSYTIEATTRYAGETGNFVLAMTVDEAEGLQ